MTEKEVQRLLEAEKFAARLTRIWAPISQNGEFSPSWALEFDHFRFQCPITENMRFEMSLHKYSCQLELKRENVHFDESRPWYEDSPITVTGSLVTDETGSIYIGRGEEREDRELCAQFAAEWEPIFRRSCWLSGYPIECSNHEKVEWMRGFTSEEIEQFTAQPLLSSESFPDYHDELHKMMNRVLEKFGIGIKEYDLLCTVGYHIYLSAEDLIHQTARYDGEENSVLNDYAQALNSCFDKGWLQPVASQAYEAEAKRRQVSPLPELFEAESQPQVGEVDFTPQGYSTFREAILEMFALDHIDHSDSGWNLNEDKREFEVLSSTRKYLQLRVREILGEPSVWVGQEVVVASVGTPEPIGPWKPNPFVTLPEGIRCVVVYKLGQQEE